MFASGEASPQRINDILEFFDIQADVEISKRLSRFEPYGGVKVWRTDITLTDRESLKSVGGVKDSAGIYAGCKLYVYPFESLTLEGSAFGEYSISIGWNIAF
jgi:hypothetical protein